MVCAVCFIMFILIQIMTDCLRPTAIVRIIFDMQSIVQEVNAI